MDILDNNPLSDMSSVNIFSQSLICLLILLKLDAFHQIKMQRGKCDLINNSKYLLKQSSSYKRNINVPAFKGINEFIPKSSIKELFFGTNNEKVHLLQASLSYPPIHVMSLLYFEENLEP